MTKKNTLLRFFSFIVVFALLSGQGVWAQEFSLEQVRLSFSKSLLEEQACAELHSKMEAEKNVTDPVWMAYFATVTMTMAKYTFNPISKFHYFNRGKEIIAKSIELDPKNIEVRFLRFTLQDHAPTFLGYDKEIAEDKKYLLENIESIQALQLKKAIVKYIADCDKFTVSEKKWVATLASL